MTDQEINIAIAEACGWKRITRLGGELHGWIEPGYLEEIPDYCYDLNAIEKAESTLPPDKLRESGMILQDILVEEMRANGCKTQADFDAKPVWIWRAKARQRCEAFLKTIGKWKD